MDYGLSKKDRIFSIGKPSRKKRKSRTKFFSLGGKAKKRGKYFSI